MMELEENENRKGKNKPREENVTPQNLNPEIKGWTNYAMKSCKSKQRRRDYKKKKLQQLCKRFEIRNKVFKHEKYVNGLQNNA